ncbi:MAG: hypothetical protein WCR52_24345 [Bacteroidota bacterium]
MPADSGLNDMYSPDDLIFITPERSFPEMASGGFARKVFVLVLKEPDAPGNRDFLTKILAAAQVNLEKDTLWAEVSAMEAPAPAATFSIKHPDHILVFGLTPEQVGLKIDAPLYRPVAFYGATWLFSEPLSVLEPDKNRKGLLWKALQQIFL